MVVIALTGAACAGARGGPVLQPSLDPAAVAATALELQGRRYAFGGATPGGFDSSGFTHYVYAQHGIELPRVAALQYRVGTPVGRSGLRPGDLVFFDTAASRSPSHVGLLIGDDRFLYASVALGEVRVDHLGTRYWRQHYLGARRIAASPGLGRSGWDGYVARPRPKRVGRGKTGSSMRRLRPSTSGHLARRTALAAAPGASTRLKTQAVIATLLRPGDSIQRDASGCGNRVRDLSLPSLPVGWADGAAPAAFRGSSSLTSPWRLPFQTAEA